VHKSEELEAEVRLLEEIVAGAEGVVSHNVGGDGAQAVVHVHLAACFKRFTNQGGEKLGLLMHNVLQLEYDFPREK